MSGFILEYFGDFSKANVIGHRGSNSIILLFLKLMWDTGVKISFIINIQKRTDNDS